MKDLIIQKKKEIILFLIFSLSLFLIIFQFTDTPMPWVDEGINTEVARNIALHGTIGMQVSPGDFFSMRNSLLSSSYPVIFPVAGSLYLFGTGIWQSRLPMLIYMFILVILFYLFTKKRYGFYTALLSVLMLISFSPFYGNGRPVQGEVPGLVFFVLGSWSLLFWEESHFKERKWALLAGLAFGLVASTKPIFLLSTVPSLIIALFLWRKKIEYKKVLLFFGLGFLLPILVWTFIHFPNVKMFLTVIPNYLFLAGNHGSSLSSTETIIVNLKRFFTESTPILFFILLVGVVFSLVFAFRKKREWNYSISECVILSFIILNWIGYLKGTGWYRYFFPAHTLLYLIFPVAISNLRIIVDKPALKKMLLVFPLFLIVFQFAHLIFWSDTSFFAKHTRSSELSTTLSTVSLNKKILFYESPEAIIFLKGDNYDQFFTMGDFFNFGDEKAILHPSEDFILARGDYNITCYDKTAVSRYHFFKKIKDCSK